MSAQVYKSKKSVNGMLAEVLSWSEDFAKVDDAGGLDFIYSELFDLCKKCYERSLNIPSLNCMS